MQKFVDVGMILILVGFLQIFFYWVNERRGKNGLLKGFDPVIANFGGIIAIIIGVDMILEWRTIDGITRGLSGSIEGMRETVSIQFTFILLVTMVAVLNGIKSLKKMMDKQNTSAAGSLAGHLFFSFGMVVPIMMIPFGLFSERVRIEDRHDAIAGIFLGMDMSSGTHKEDIPGGYRLSVIENGTFFLDVTCEGERIKRVGSVSARVGDREIPLRNSRAIEMVLAHGCVK